MTRLYFQVGHLRLKTLLLFLFCFILLGTVNTLVFSSMVDSSRAMIFRHALIVGGVLLVAFLSLGGYLWHTLKPIALLLHHYRRFGGGPCSHADRARDVSLRFPHSFILLLLILSLPCVFIIALADAFILKLEGELIAALSLSSLAFVLSLCFMFYIFLRLMLRPIRLHFRHEEVPNGIRISAMSKVTAAIFALTLISSVPATFLSVRRISILQAKIHAASESHLAEVIAYGATLMDSRSLRDSIARMKLSPSHTIRLTQQDSPTAAPLPSDHQAAFVEVVSKGELTTRSTILILLVLSTLGLAIFVGHNIGSALVKDVSLLNQRIQSLVQSSHESLEKSDTASGPMLVGIPQFSDLKLISDSVNALLNRMMQIHVVHFLAIEKTLDAEQIKMQFLANVSHDLRSPLNSILGFSELLCRDTAYPLTPDQRESIETIHQSGYELLGLIDPCSCSCV